MSGSYPGVTKPGVLQDVKLSDEKQLTNAGFQRYFDNLAAPGRLGEYVHQS